MSITEQHKKTATKFINSINELMEFVDNIKTLIPEGEYLKACNTLKDHYKLKDEIGNTRTIIEYVNDLTTNIRNDEVYRSYDRRVRMKTKQKSEMLSDEDKIKKGWVLCKNCDRLIKKGGMFAHLRADVCKRTKESKCVVISTGTSLNNDTIKAIHLIRGALIKCGRDGKWF